MKPSSFRWNSEVWPEETSPEKDHDATPPPAVVWTDQYDPELATLLGPGASFQGTLSLKGNVRLDGTLSGHLFATGLVVIGDGARVSGEVRAKRVIILGGIIEANVDAEESIEIRQAAQVRGDLRSPEIYMDRGVRFTGTCDMSDGPQNRSPLAPETA